MDDEIPAGQFDRDHDSGFSLVLPFVCVSSVGGPFDDEAFAAGWECGRVDALLSVAEGGGPYDMPICRAALAAQFDLVAMRHGYTVEVVPDETLPEWAHATFTPGATPS